MTRRGPGLDTSVVLRLLTGEPAKQAQAASEFFQSQVSTGVLPCVSDQVISETYFALCYHYRVPKSEAIRVLQSFLGGGEVICLGVCEAVLSQPNLGRTNPGFVDRIIHAQYLRANADGMVTFERAGSRLPGVVVLR